jgi:formate hydrogenlyase subunit 4
MEARIMIAVFHLLLALTLSPLLLGVINRTKAIFAGRSGQPLLQLYYDLAKLLKKGAVYSRTTTWVFRAGPVIGLASVLAACALLPLGGRPSLLSFPGDFLVLAYLLGLARFFTILAAMDTGSSFEGMGASREAAFSALAEPALLLSMVAMALRSGRLSLSDMLASPLGWGHFAPALWLVSAAVFIVFLAENARVPVDDPSTHLELTMIHEVMVLDHSGPDLAYILYGAALKLWVLGALWVGIVIPFGGTQPLIGTALALVAMLGLAVFIGVVESMMARLRLSRIPPLLIGAGVCALLALMVARP